MRDTEKEREKEAETQAEGEAGSMQGARCGIRFRVSRIAPWAKGRRLTPIWDPSSEIFKNVLSVWGKRHRDSASEKSPWGHLDGSAVVCLPLAQSVIPGSGDQVPHWAPCEESASPSAYVSASLCVSHE